MTFQEFRQTFAHFPIISLQDIRKHYPRFDQRRLVEWQDRGLLEKVRNRFYRLDGNTPEILEQWYIANQIYDHSYVSLESALQYYGFIPEGVFQVTSVSTRKTTSFEFRGIQFKYRKIAGGLFLGYKLLPWQDEHFVKIATPEKALADTLYLNPNLKESADFEALRLNKTQLRATIDDGIFNNLTRLIPQKTTRQRLFNFKTWLYA